MAPSAPSGIGFTFGILRLLSWSNEPGGIVPLSGAHGSWTGVNSPSRTRSPAGLAPRRKETGIDAAATRPSMVRGRLSRSAPPGGDAMSRSHRAAVALFVALAAGPALEAAGPMLIYRDPQILDVATGFPGIVRSASLGDV